MHAAFGTDLAVILMEILKSTASAVFLETLKKNRHLKNRHEAYTTFERAFGDVHRGQYLDVLYQDCTDISEDSYYAMIALTTGSLLKASLVIGGMLAGLPQPLIKQLARFGSAFGYIHQLIYDLCYYWPEHYDLGREMGEDLRQRNKRLPVIHCLSQNSGHSKRLAGILSKSTLAKSDLLEARQLLQKSGSFLHVRHEITRFAQEALRSLAGFRRRRATACLKAAVHYFAAV